MNDKEKELELEELLQDKIAVMKDLLKNYQSEQSAILQHDRDHIHELIKRREPLLDQLDGFREKILRLLVQLGKIKLDNHECIDMVSSEESLNTLFNYVLCGNEKMLILKEEILTLAEKLHLQSKRNTFFYDGF